MLEATTCTKIYGQQRLGKSRPTWLTYRYAVAVLKQEAVIIWTLAKSSLFYMLYNDGE